MNPSKKTCKLPSWRKHTHVQVCVHSGDSADPNQGAGVQVEVPGVKHTEVTLKLGSLFSCSLFNGLSILSIV